VIAHRGSHGEGVLENTIAAFERAVAAGANMIELDVRRTADDELVVFHDDVVGTERISSLTLCELRERTVTEVPRLPDVLDWASGQIGLNVELKEDGYVERVAALLGSFADRGGELLVTSFLEPVVAGLSRSWPSSPRGLLIEFDAVDAVSRALQCGAGSLVVETKLVTDTLIGEAVEEGLQFLVWDFIASTPSHAVLLRDPRIAGVITDDVPGALAAL
jgi:glycerophosphoryl diester phosphodiesterase